MSAEPTFLQALESLDHIQDEPQRVQQLLTLTHRILSDDDTEHDEFMGRALMQRVRALTRVEHKLDVFAALADWLGASGAASWVGRMFEELVLAGRELSSEQHRIAAGFILSEQFLGTDALRPALADAPFVKHAALSALVLSLSNEVAYRERLVRRIRFIQEHISNTYAVVPETWDELLEASQKLGQWEYEVLDGSGACAWRLSPLPAILGIMARDFNRSDQRDWAASFFQRLLQQLKALSPSPDRERALRELMFGLASSEYMDLDDGPQAPGDPRFDEDEAMQRATILEWMGQVIGAAAYTQQDPSLIYEGMFLGFLYNDEIHQAHRVALRIPNSRLRDQALARVLQAWLDEHDPESAVQVLHEIQDGALRGEWVLTLSRDPAVVRHPVACAMLLEVAVGLPHITQKAMRQVIEHPEFPAQARQAILEQSPRRPLSHLARRERLEELSLLRPHLPLAIYREHRRTLLGLIQPDISQEKVSMGSRVVIDCPHAYGENVYHTPREHVQRNHFGADVAGSRVTGWSDFDDMWEEIAATVEDRVRDDGSIQVFELTFPIDVGTNGLIPFEQAPPEGIGVEIRNGHPSLYCKAAGQQYPTRTLTVVVGPSEVAPDELPGYNGHQLPCVLYTVYPGESAAPFPRWSTADLPRLEASTQAALKLLQAGQIEEAKAVLYEAYSQLNGTDEAARFWSRHLLLR